MALLLRSFLNEKHQLILCLVHCTIYNRYFYCNLVIEFGALYLNLYRSSKFLYIFICTFAVNRYGFVDDGRCMW